MIAQKIKEDSESYEILAIGHSAYPRDVEGSYMPCFLVGEAVSDILASLYGIDNYKFSHQAGHIKASVYSSGVKEEKEFIDILQKYDPDYNLFISLPPGWYKEEVPAERVAVKDCPISVRDALFDYDEVVVKRF